MSKHGVFVLESETALTAPITGSSVPVVIGTAPVNMIDTPADAVNTPILANSAAEAMAELGYVDDFAGFTLCGMMYATNNIYAVSPVVYINVLDPTKHKVALSSVTVTMTDNEGAIEQTGILKDGLTVKAGSTSLVEGTDYDLSFNTSGYLVITAISTQAKEATTLTVTGNKLDPSKVTAADIIGAIDTSTGAETGMECIRQVYPKLGVVPSLLLAPGWSQTPTVGIALAAKAANINGVFKAMALVDLDTSADKARKYTDCKTVKEDSGYTSEFCAVLWPCLKVGDYIFPYSTIYAALAAYTDANNDDVPSKSPSNKMLGITGTCLADGTSIVLDQDQGSTVNSYGVVTAINMNGWRSWGNYTGAYPSSGDAKDIWIPVRRMFNWQGNNFIQTYFEKVDDPMNYVLIENIVDSENIRCAAYAPAKWAGASIEYLEADNPITDVLAGKMTFRQHIAPYTPAQEIDNIINYDTTLLQSALTGGE